MASGETRVARRARTRPLRYRHGRAADPPVRDRAGGGDPRARRSARSRSSTRTSRCSSASPTATRSPQPRFELAREEAARADERIAAGEADLPPLLGVPATIKELIAVEGMPHTGGFPHRRGFREPADAPVVARLRAAGAIVLGVGNTPGPFYWLETNNRIYGRTSNAYDPERTAGGSSGGDGAMVGSGARADRAGLGHGRLDPRARLRQRDLRAPALARSRPDHRALPDAVGPDPAHPVHRAAGPAGARSRAGAAHHRRPGRPRPVRGDDAAGRPEHGVGLGPARARRQRDVDAADATRDRAGASIGPRSCSATPARRSRRCRCAGCAGRSRSSARSPGASSTCSRPGRP